MVFLGRSCQNELMRLNDLKIQKTIVKIRPQYEWMSKMPSQVLLFRHFFYNSLVFLSCQIQGKSARFLNFRLIHGPGCVAPPGGGNAC